MGHGGSGNHGCEALVRSITKVCDISRNELGIYSYRPAQDRLFGILNYASFIKQSSLSDTDVLEHYQSGLIACSIGGDNYCSYPNPRLADCNRSFHKAGAKTALIGCSIDPEVLEHGEIIGDLCQYELITARESITYQNLLKKGVNKNLHLIPDSAFTLDPSPSNIKLKPHTIGLNISNIAFSASGEDFFINIVELITYILQKTNYNIALIPHVHQDFNDDAEILHRVYEYFLEDTRITLLNTNLNVCQIKHVVSQCELLVAARTHCSVAGYSTFVPTLVLGYSVKSIGIAKDIFGTYDNYVQSVYDLKDKNRIKNAFIWLDKNKNSIKQHLIKTMPAYTKKAYQLKKELLRLNQPKSEYSYKVPKLPKAGYYQKGILSIITSCYNSEDYLYRYLDSLLNQTNHNIQLVIVNDGSTDNTEKIILNYKPVLESAGIEVVYLKQHNTGISGAYNLAFPYLTGQFFCWCDSDNFYSPNFVEKILNYTEKHPNIKILRHDGYLINEEDCRKTDIFNIKFKHKFSATSHNPRKKHLFMNSLLEKNWHFGNIILDTKSFTALTNRHIYPSRYGQNWQICLPMLKEYEAAYIPDVLFYFVIRHKSVSHQNLKEGDNSLLFYQFDGYKKILEETIKAMKLPNEKDLLKIIDQKYIYRKLTIAQETKNKADIEKYQTLFDQEVAPNNLYQQAIDALND